MLHADWLQELPEDLDMCIAQRDFEGAVDLVERGMHLVGRLFEFSWPLRQYSLHIESFLKDSKIEQRDRIEEKTAPFGTCCKHIRPLKYFKPEYK